MPNLLKSLPREILEKEDTKFIYNILNPLLFEKVRDIQKDIRKSYTVNELFEKDIKIPGQFDSKYIFPFNINSREFHAYMDNGQEKIKLERYNKTELVQELDDLKDYMFFYFNTKGYEFLQTIIEKFYFIKNESDKNKKLYESNLEKYTVSVDVKKKKVYKQTYEHFKSLYDEYFNLYQEFDIIITEMSQFASYSSNQILDNIANSLGNHLHIKTFDNDIIFENSAIFEYLTTFVSYNETVTKHIFSGKNIIESHVYTPKNIFELMVEFSMELSTIKKKYDKYLSLLVDNGDVGYSLQKSNYKKLKNTKFDSINIDLESDNLTYFLNEESNQLEIYLYFNKTFRIDESTLKVTINDSIIDKSIISNQGTINYGYTIFNYMDDETKYYKITVHDYLEKDLDGMYLNYDIDTINLNFTAVDSILENITNVNSPIIETTSFLDNFVLYKKNDSGFYEEMKIPFKIKIDIDEKEDRYIRVFEFKGIDEESHNELINENEIIISCYAYDYVYEPKLYVDFFKYAKYEVNFRYNTIIPFVLIDDVMQETFELKYYEEIGITDFNTNMYKNVLMSNGKPYKKLFDETNQMVLMNPYNETNTQYISKITYSQYKERPHTRAILIDEMVKKIPFYENLKYLEKFQYDKNRDALIFMNLGNQLIVPLHEDLKRGLNIENLDFDKRTGRVKYHKMDICDEGFVFANEKIYLKNPITHNMDHIEAVSPEDINMTNKEKIIFFDMFEMSHCVVLDNKQYKITNMYVATNDQAMLSNKPVLYVENKFGIPRYKNKYGDIVDIDLTRQIIEMDQSHNNSIIFDRENVKLILRYDENDIHTLELEEIHKKKNFHNQAGMTTFSIFYAGNALPENSNKTFFGRENIFSSMTIPDDIYKIGRSEDYVNDTQSHNLLGEQLDLNAEDSAKHNMEQEPYLMFKTSTASLKGLETYLKSNLKSISQDIKVSPVYLVQRNRFISEWARVSSVLPYSIYAVEPLKELVADLMETKLINGKYDDLMDIFKSNEYEKFSLDTNNIHNILVQYILRYLEDDFLLEDFNYYLVYNVWMDNNRKKIIDFIKSNAEEKIIKQISTMSFNSSFEKEKLFYIFITELEKINKTTIETYKPIANYSDWIDIKENNKVHFEKPFKYDIVDISDFITMPIDWKKPLLLIRPLVDDGVFTRRDYRFLDLSIATNSQVTYNDAYNEYVEDIKCKLNKPVDYLDETLRVMNDLSIDNGYDFLGINLVIVRWIVERFLPNYILSNNVETVENLRNVISTELTSVEHPNMIVSYNRIKESTLLTDLGNNVTEIYNTIIDNNLVTNSFINLEISDTNELAYLDKIKKPVEHYFDFLFDIKRYDLLTKILALFTEDVIASSMLDLSLAINIKNSKGDETYDHYEKMISELFDEFLPFHSVLDKIIFTIKIMESSSSEAISKEASVDIDDTALIDIFMDFAEKVRIQTIDRSIIEGNPSIIFPSEGFRLYNPDGGEFPQDFSRRFKPGGNSLVPMDALGYGMDDDYYIENIKDWAPRSIDIYTPPSFANLIFSEMSENDYEQIADVYIDDYFHIKQNIFEQDERIDSHFIDYIPTVDISQGVSENPEINIVEDYLIAIDTTFNIRFYDMEKLPMDAYGLDEYAGPEDQTTLIGMKEAMYQNIVQNFYETLNVGVLDSIWTDIIVVYDMLNIPGHDEFGIDEYYHQRGPDTLGQDMSVMVYDELLHQGFEITATDMSDISIIDKKLSQTVFMDINHNVTIEPVDTLHTTIKIWAGREKPSLITENGTFIPGQDEFGYDEFYHDSADLDRIANMIDLSMVDALGIIRIDFGFMRMLPIDPYQDLIDQKFYRANQPGSDLNSARVRDKFTTDIRTFGKDYIGVNTLDFYTIDIINEDIRREIYSQIENDKITGDYFAASFEDSLINRHIHYDFREHIVALDNYASVLDDETIIKIFGVRAANIQRDELFTLRVGDNIITDIKMKYPLEKSMTRIDKDYLKSIKIEEENFVDFRYQDRDLEVRFSENLLTYYKFSETSNVLLTEINKLNIENRNKETLETTVFEKLHYGNRHSFDISGMSISTSDSLKEIWANRIYKDSLITTITSDSIETDISYEYEFLEERVLQPHDEYGQMGYTDESLERSIDSRLTDSLISISKDIFVDEGYVNVYDTVMQDVSDYFGEYINVVISDSLNTYIDIVKQPWIWPEFDEFGHDEQPHMYTGESDEFDLSTQLRDRMKIDASTWLYNSGALIQMSDRIQIDENNKFIDNKLSVSMTDDLKVISVGFKDNVNIISTDLTNISKNFKDKPVNIVVQDSVWYGYKLRENSSIVRTIDNVDYGYDNMTAKDLIINTKITDWLLTSYIFQEQQPVIFSDTLICIDNGSIFEEPETLNINIKETLIVNDYKTIYFNDKMDIQLSDRITMIDNDENARGFNPNDIANVSMVDTLEYGYGKIFNEKVRGFILNRMSAYEKSDKGPNINITLEDSFFVYTAVPPIKDSLGISTYERLKYGMIFRDALDISLIRDDHLIIDRQWVVNRYGVDTIIHNQNGVGMEYYDDISIDNSITTQLFDNVRIVADNITFKDTLDIVSVDKIISRDGDISSFSMNKKDTGIIVNSSDNLMYGVGYYDYIWDAKEWDNYGYELPYENWNGLIPHDEIPYDEMEHGQQGDDISQITTGVSDNLLYGFDCLFKDTLVVGMDDKGGFDTWGYQSSFKENVGVWVENRLQTAYVSYNDELLDAQIRKEQMGVSYEFEDTIKTHKYISDKDISTEQIDIYNLETHQLLEQIFKYRIYEELDIQINSDLLSTSLFKFDDELSLVTDYNTKIELYKEQSDGSLAKSMTVIKDKSTSNVSLFFGDFVSASIFDKIQGSYTEIPDEYLE